MARNKLTDLSATAAENTDLQNVNVAEGMAPGGVNNALRALAGMLGDAFALATPGTKLKTVQAEKFHVADDADQLQIGSTRSTVVKHDNLTHTTSIDAQRNLTVKVGEPGDGGASAFTVVENDATLGDITVIKQTNNGGLELGNAALNAQRAAANDTTAAVTVAGTLSATKLVGDGSGLTNLNSGSSPIPVGLIAMWSGTAATVPAGWALCDGGSGRPDLRNKFIMGAAASTSGGYETPGGTGGASSYTLAENQMPSHNHAAGSIGRNHKHSVANVSLPNHTHSRGTLQVGSHKHTLQNTSHTHVVKFGEWNFAPFNSINLNGTSKVLTTENAVSENVTSQPRSVGDETDPQSVNLTGSTGSVSGSVKIGSGQETAVPDASGGYLSGTSGNRGGSAAIDNRPAFYALAFIIFEGT